MDKKTEIARAKGLEIDATTPPTAAVTTISGAVALAAAPSAPGAAPAPTGWWMYHGDPAHTGYVSDSDLNSSNVTSTPNQPSAQAFGPLFTIQMDGPVLSVPAVTDGCVYVGLANSQAAAGGNGGSFLQIDIQTGQTKNRFDWDLGDDAEDAHSFAGMGCTPAIVNGRIYFGAFNGKLYCLDQSLLTPIWVTDLRNADPAHNQPITNIAGVAGGAPPPVPWSSPVISADGSSLYIACGEGENPQLFSFVFCIDTANGNVNWIFCTNQFVENVPNAPNVLPAGAVGISPLPSQYSVSSAGPIIMGCSVWGAIAYDSELNRIYCSTGNQAPEPAAPPELPSPGYSNGVLSLDASTGEFKAFFQVPCESNYRPSDFDIDVGGAPMLFTLTGANAQKFVCFGCKNGSFFVLDPDTLAFIKRRQLLPYMNDGTTWVEGVDRHPIDPNAINPHVSNDESNATQGENFSGVFNTPAFYPGSSDNPQTISPRCFIAIGGPNYHNASPGIDYESTPFMRAIDAVTLQDVWPMDNNDPRRYSNPTFVDPNISTQVGMYSTAGESGLSSPAVVNDVVFCTTSKIAIYGFNVRDGSFLWYDDLGMQTDGYNGGYGYCLGPAIWRNYVVAGALVFGGQGGGILKIYGFLPKSNT
jgi:outer membrane protein assembly factor BamB